jgi:hypothetical protein
MSGKSHEDIYDSLESLLAKEDSEKVRKLIEILDARRPEVPIDRKVKVELKRSLISQPSRRSWIDRLPSIRWIGGVSLACASFIAVFGLARITGEITPLDTIPEKTDSVATLSTPIVPEPENSIREDVPRVSESMIEQYRAEKREIDTEISDITLDIMDGVDKMTLTQNKSTNPYDTPPTTPIASMLATPMSMPPIEAPLT